MLATFPLVPWPASVEPGDGVLDLTHVDLHCDDPARWVPLATELLAPLGATVTGRPGAATETVADRRGGAVVELRREHGSREATGSRAEAYRLEVRADGAVISAPADVGLLHGLRTLRQLVGADLTAPAVVVRDAPRFAWRGLMLDVARHWFGPTVLRRVVDLAGAYKLRVLHLHLTDDQGWRLEVPSRPALAGVSGRTQSDGLVPDGERGYLTLDEYRELQEYAAARFVEIVPEIDVPGHTNAATHACGELNPDGAPTPAYGGREVGFSRLWFDNPATEPWLRDVIGAVADATVGPHVHLGGDECLTLDAPEYARLVELATGIVRAHGKTPVVWQEAAAANLPEGTVVQYWDPRPDPAALLRAAQAGARVVMSPASHVYLDMKPEAGFPLGQDWVRHDVDLRDSYGWEPTTTVPGLSADAVVGVEAALWTEAVVTEVDVFTMLLPRLPAAAEVAWTPPVGRDWDALRARIVHHARTWDAHGWSWHPSKDADWAQQSAAGDPAGHAEAAAEAAGQTQGEKRTI